MSRVYEALKKAEQERATVGHQRRRNLLARGLTGSVVVVAIVASVILLSRHRARIAEFVGDLKRPAARGVRTSHPERSADVATSKLIAVPQQPQPHFAVQVGAFPDRTCAEALASHLSNLYQQEILIAPIEVRGKTFYRVRFLVGTKADAEALANSMLRGQRLKAWIVALP